MTNAEVVKSWIDYCNGINHSLPPYHAVKSIHCSSTKLYSYLTPIAEFKDNTIYLTKVKYSHTTSKHQSLVKYFADNVVMVDNEIEGKLCA